MLEPKGRQMSPPWAAQTHVAPLGGTAKGEELSVYTKSCVINLEASINNSWNSWSVGPGPAQQRGEASFNHTTALRGGESACEDKREVLLLKYSLS